MLIVLRKKYLCLALLPVLLLSVFALFEPTRCPVSAPAPVSEKETVLIIDPGHGGEDGGAVAADGTVESQINLAVALRLREVLLLCGVEGKMTREEDVSLASEKAQTLREKKRSDLENRVSAVASCPEAVLISIHQNSLPSEPSVWGAQVFYGRQEGSEALALQLQQQLNGAVNGEKNKSCREIDSSIYLLRHVSCPAVLVECGFLSHGEERERLKQREHQTRLALSIGAGFLQWQNST